MRCGVAHGRWSFGSVRSVRRRMFPRFKSCGGRVRLAAENITFKTMKDGIASFRRNPPSVGYVGTLGGANIIVDYAHHPTAVREKSRRAGRYGRTRGSRPSLSRTSGCGRRDSKKSMRARSNLRMPPVSCRFTSARQDGRTSKTVTRRIAEENALTWLADYDAGFGGMQKFAKDSADKEAIIIVMGAGPIDGQIRKRMQAGADTMNT